MPQYMALELVGEAIIRICLTDFRGLLIACPGSEPELRFARSNRRSNPYLCFMLQGFMLQAEGPPE